MMGGSQGTDQVTVPTAVRNRTSKYTPFITNDQKEVYVKKLETASTPQSAPQSAPPAKKGSSTAPSTSKGYNVGLGPQPDKGVQPTFRLEMYPEPKDQRQPLFVPTGGISSGPPFKLPPLIEPKVYNIHIPGPTGGHVEMKKIIESALPGKEGRFTSTTLGERLQMYDYVKQILIQVSDGEEMGLDSESHRSLLSYIKLLELNPNAYSPIHSNPYSCLPYGLLIYRSCFPIVLDKVSQTITCAKDAIGLNIRLYALSIAEYFSYCYRQPFYIQYDVWRELSWYEYIREQIIKKKISPNFTLLYAFFLSPNRKIDFFSLKGHTLTQKDLMTKEYEKFRIIHSYNIKNVNDKLGISNPLVSLHMNKKIPLSNITNTYDDQLPDEIDPTLQLYSGTTLMLITESPHQNIYQWASRGYEKDGIVDRMTSRGYHDERIWLSVLFQIVSAMYVMQLHGLYVRSMSLEDNFFIKDLKTTVGKASGYWKYVIDGLTYYVPNYGYLVMVDSNFKDIIPMVTTLDKYDRQYKVYAKNIFGKQFDESELKQKVYENFKNIISTNNFTKEHTRNNVFRPPETVMGLMDRMMTDSETDIGKIIRNHFMPLLNNRVGTLLKKDNEMPNIRDLTQNLKIGEMIPQIIEENVLKWCIYTGRNPDNTVNIITRTSNETKDYRIEKVNINTLKQYSPSEKIEQLFDKDVNFSDEHLLETYIVSP